MTRLQITEIAQRMLGTRSDKTLEKTPPTFDEIVELCVRVHNEVKEEDACMFESMPAPRRTLADKLREGKLACDTPDKVT